MKFYGENSMRKCELLVHAQRSGPPCECKPCGDDSVNDKHEEKVTTTTMT